MNQSFSENYEANEVRTTFGGLCSFSFLCKMSDPKTTKNDVVFCPTKYFLALPPAHSAISTRAVQAASSTASGSGPREGVPPSAEGGGGAARAVPRHDHTLVLAPAAAVEGDLHVWRLADCGRCHALDWGLGGCR